MDDDQQFCLRWNNHQSTLVSVFDTLLEKGMHVDCTLAAEGQTLKAHKVVLSACSPYFESVLSQQYDKHPIIILKDVKYAELRAMMDYMYRGEVNISQDQLAALLKAAESLQIKGLSDNKPSRPPSRPAPAPPGPALPVLPAHPPHTALATLPAHPAPPAHPPRAPSPPPMARSGSADSRSGSVSPSRRRKKARRDSSPAPASADEPCKEERDGVEDLTLDEDHDDQPVAHNDVVRNFQWHLERSQDEIMNSSDGVRDTQDPKTPLRPSIVTRSKKIVEEPRATTFAVLKTVTSPNRGPARAEPRPNPPAEPPAEPRVEPRAEPEPPAKENKAESPLSDKASPPSSRRPDKRYKCTNCYRCYNARKNLVRHETLECGREPQYKCPHCACSKHRRNELKNHIQKKHPNLANVK